MIDAPSTERDRSQILDLKVNELAYFGAVVAAISGIFFAIVQHIPRSEGQTPVPYPRETLYLVLLSGVLLAVTLVSVGLAFAFLARWTHRNHIQFDCTLNEINYKFDHALNEVKKQFDCALNEVKQQHEYLSRLVGSLSGPYMMTWELSARYELHARTVLCLTGDLYWASRSIGNIIEDAPSNPYDKYCYIVFWGSEAAASVNAHPV
jgi:hypothetical protein